MILHLERLTDIQDGRYDTAMALYAESFPPHEHRQIASQEAILRDKRYRFELVFDGVEWVGLLLCWETKDFIYVEHFCIVPELRNRHYGQRTLSLLQQSGKTIVLEIDPPEDWVSCRRAGFYARCGYCTNPYPHVHPPYHVENSGHRLVVLSFPKALTETAYQSFYKFLQDVVMYDCF